VTQPPDDLTQPIPSDATHEQPAVEPTGPVADGGAHVAVPGGETATPAWANAAHEGDGAASARPVRGPGVSAAAPVVAAVPVVPAVAQAEKKSWRTRVSGGRGLAVGALIVGLGLGAVGGAAATWAVTHDNGSGTVADGTGRLGPDGDGDFGPHGGRGGPPPRGQLPDGGQQQNGDGGTTGQPPGGGAGTDGSTGDGGTDANGTSQAT
jgi:hypothetical protein